MNAHQRRKRATAHHYRMPLGCAVRVYSRDRKTFADGVLSKHDRSQCIVDFPDHNLFTYGDQTSGAQPRPYAWISYSRVRPLTVNRVRPWWRDVRAKHKAAARSR